VGGGSEGDVYGGCDGLCRLRRVDWGSDADADAVALKGSALGVELGSEGSSSPRMSSSSSGPLR